MRAELLGQLLAAQFDLETVVAKLTSAGASADAAQNQIQFLVGLQRAVGSANPIALAQMRSEIAATVNAAQIIAANSRGASNADTQPDRPMTAAEARQAIADVGRDVFGRRVFDPYLQFASAEDERAYREREQRNREDYERELAKGTPEGDRKAAAILQGQLADAKAHGADASPDFAALSRKADAAHDSLSAPNRQPLPSPTKPATAEDKGADSSELGGALAALRAAGVTTLEPATGKPAMGSPPISALPQLSATADRGAPLSWLIPACGTATASALCSLGRGEYSMSHERSPNPAPRSFERWSALAGDRA